jgi:hypothetical protein
MEAPESPLTIYSQMTSLARERGVDIASLCNGHGFWTDSRYISLWRRNGVIHYSLQGSITALPDRFRPSAAEFHGQYGESGTFDDMEQAFLFLQAWLLKCSEVDDLPKRLIGRQGIG